MKRHNLLPLLGVFLLGVSGCVQATRTARVSSDWSRGLLLGNSTTADTLAMGLSPTEDLLLTVWPARAGSATEETLHLLALDTTSGSAAMEQDLPTPGGNPRAPMLIPLEKSGFHLLWLDGPYTERALYHTLLGPDGAPLGDASRISPRGLQIVDVRADPLPDGGLMILWTTQPGTSPFRLDLYLSRLDAEGQPLSSPSPLLSGVLQADVAVDAQGTVHLAWLDQTSIRRYPIRYAAIQPDATTISTFIDVTDVFLRDTQTGRDIDGPFLGIEQDKVYISWVWETRRGEQVGFVSVEDKRPSELHPLYLSPSFPPPCEPVEDVLALTCLAPALPSITGSASVHQVSVTSLSQQKQTLLALSLQARTRSRAILQPVLAVLEDGRLLGYTPVAWTGKPSVGISVAADGAGDIYMCWSDTSGIAGSHPVYLATTSPAMQATFNQLTAADVLTSLIDAGQRAVQGVVFLPLVALWGILPLVWLLIGLRLSGGDPRVNVARLILMLAVGLHCVSKYLITADLLFYLPRLAYAPPWLAPFLVYLTPIATVIVGIALIRLFYIRSRTDEFSPFLAYLFVAIIDIVISTGLYGLALSE